MFFKPITFRDEEEENTMEKFDTGYYNGVVLGYLIVAMKYSGFNVDETCRAIEGLHGALASYPASFADRITMWDWDKL